MTQKLLTPILDYYLLTRVVNQDRKTHCFHPSSLSSCPRKLYESYLIEDYSLIKEEPRLARIFENGHGVHKRLQTNFRDAGLLIDEDVPISDDKFEICGEIDGLLKYWDELIVLDVKSINKKGFRNLFRPSESHIIQLNVYLYCLGLRYGILLYECKDDQEIAEYLVEYDPRVLLPIFRKIKYVQECLKSNTVPPRHDGYSCRWCEYDKTCE